MKLLQHVRSIPRSFQLSSNAVFLQPASYDGENKYSNSNKVATLSIPTELSRTTNVSVPSREEAFTPEVASTEIGLLYK